MPYFTTHQPLFRSQNPEVLREGGREEGLQLPDEARSVAFAIHAGAINGKTSACIALMALGFGVLNKEVHHWC